jgi:tRNA pseudouridine32 synthase/23S rRNA pseudouridine746 synthase
MKIIFENSHFAVIDKEACVLSVPARTGAADPRPVAGLLLQEQLGIQIFPVHRLDFEVSGLLLFAKTKKAHSAANSWFENKEVQKTYIALSTGLAPSTQEFEWKSQILRGKKRAYESPVGKRSVTLAKYLPQKTTREGYLFWELNPVTGRSHQLRFDLSRHGFAILGDRLYGSPVDWSTVPGAIALQAQSMRFPIAAKDFDLPLELEVAPAF